MKFLICLWSFYEISTCFVIFEFPQASHHFNIFRTFIFFLLNLNLFAIFSLFAAVLCKIKFHFITFLPRLKKNMKKGHCRCIKSREKRCELATLKDTCCDFMKEQHLSESNLTEYSVQQHRQRAGWWNVHRINDSQTAAASSTAARISLWCYLLRASKI